jgi:hypothetical protein
MSEQQAEHASAEAGSLNVGPAVPVSSDPQGEPRADGASDGTSLVEAASSAPDHVATAVDATKVEVPKMSVPRPDAPGIDKLMAMAPGDRAFGEQHASEPKAGQGSMVHGRRRVAAVAAVVALASVVGALGGALATAGLGHLVGIAQAISPATALESSIARIEADILALKADVEQTSKTGASQFNKTSERLDKLEKAQFEPAAKLARLTEAVDKLRAAPAAAAPKEVTGSVAPAQSATPAQAAPAPVAAASKAEVARLPAVEGWVLTDVGYGGALIENRHRSYEVYAGDTVPGLGRIGAIRRQDGRWVVVTSKGLIVAR